ncbi:MAG: hypothetical protein AAGA74_18535 [Pseudomonadota bacterium]
MYLSRQSPLNGQIPALIVVTPFFVFAGHVMFHLQELKPDSIGVQSFALILFVQLMVVTFAPVFWLLHRARKRKSPLVNMSESEK